MLLDSDQQLVDALPAEIREKLDGFSESFMLQVGFAWSVKDEPLPKNYLPETVEVFVNGNDEPSLLIHKNRIIAVERDFLGDAVKPTLIVAIDAIDRYVQVHGELLIDALGECPLPDVLVSPTAQLSCLTSFLKS